MGHLPFRCRFPSFAARLRRLLPQRLGLNRKLMLIVVALALLNVAISSFLLLPRQRQLALHDTRRAATQMSDVVEARLQHVMMHHNWNSLARAVESELHLSSPAHVWILDGRGTTRYSSLPDEVGRRFAYAEPGCSTCHHEGARAETWADVMRMSATDEGLINIRLIRNQPECYGCHDADERLLGFVVVAITLSEVSSELRGGLGRLAISALVTFVLLVGLLLLALRRFVTRPVGELAAGLAALQAGDMEHRVQVHSSDELGDLARAYEAMRNEIKRRRWETRRLGVLEERDRLARELHDNLAQELAYLNMKASSAQALLASGDAAQAAVSLQEFKVTARETYVDAREAIFNLRTATAPEDGLLPTLAEYLAEYKAHYGVDVSLSLDGQHLERLSPDTSIQLLRIIQEALMNVRKHANASEASVSFAGSHGWLVVTIEDDGCGFDRNTISRQGHRYFGLQIMQERAESVGGTVALSSQLGTGTRVEVRLPVTVGQ